MAEPVFFCFFRVRPPAGITDNDDLMHANDGGGKRMRRVIKWAWLRVGEGARQHRWQLGALTFAVAVCGLALNVWHSRSEINEGASVRDLTLSVNPGDAQDNVEEIRFLEANVGKIVGLNFHVYGNFGGQVLDRFIKYCDSKGYQSAIGKAAQFASIAGRPIVVPVGGSRDNLDNGLFGPDNCSTRIVLLEEDDDHSITIGGEIVDISTSGNFLITFKGTDGYGGVYTLSRRD